MECRNFTGQPIYAQITKYLSKGEIRAIPQRWRGTLCQEVRRVPAPARAVVLCIQKLQVPARNPYGSEHGSEAPVARRVHGTAEDEHFLRREQQTAQQVLRGRLQVALRKVRPFFTGQSRL